MRSRALYVHRRYSAVMDRAGRAEYETPDPRASENLTSEKRDTELSSLLR